MSTKEQILVDALLNIAAHYAVDDESFDARVYDGQDEEGVPYGAGNSNDVLEVGVSVGLSQAGEDAIYALINYGWTKADLKNVGIETRLIDFNNPY